MAKYRLNLILLAALIRVQISTPLRYPNRRDRNLLRLPSVARAAAKANFVLRRIAGFTVHHTASERGEQQPNLDALRGIERNVTSPVPIFRKLMAMERPQLNFHVQ